MIFFRKAEAIVFSQQQLPKIAQTETFFDCKYCDFKGICHKGEKPSVNCRSCLHAQPNQDAKWWCNVHKDNIPPEVIRTGLPKLAQDYLGMIGHNGGPAS